VYGAFREIDNTALDSFLIYVLSHRIEEEDTSRERCPDTGEGGLLRYPGNDSFFDLSVVHASFLDLAVAGTGAGLLLFASGTLRTQKWEGGSCYHVRQEGGNQKRITAQIACTLDTSARTP
jgi:hypothetical protein